jgi:N-acetylglucosamine-6-phosphate deacetylase
MTEQTDLLISGLTVYAQQGVLPRAAVRIQNGLISEIFQDSTLQFSGRRFNFPQTYHLVPGRIDMHIHGAHGADVMDATPAALNTIRQALAADGVTGFLATTVTESIEKIATALENVQHYRRNSVLGAEILGVHLEGPFISPRHIGAHRRELILSPDIALFDRWQSCAGDSIKLVTVAPELSGGIDFIRHLRECNVIASIGHTDADFATTELAISAGARHATHLFNAMRAFHHREPGCIGAILNNPQVMAELIADGHHCHPAALELGLRSKGKEGLILVTDAMRAQCCEAGKYELGGQTVTIHEGVARLENGVLAGSVLTMTHAVKNMLRFTHCTLSDLIYLTSINPAKALGIDSKTGSIIAGKDADLVVLDENLEVALTIGKGHAVYQRENDYVS